MILYLGGIVMRTEDAYTQIFTKQVVPPTRRYFHPLYRGTWFPTSIPERGWCTLSGWFRSAISRYLVSNRSKQASRTERVRTFPSAISRYLVSNNDSVEFEANGVHVFPSAISRYLVSNPTSKTPPLTSGGGNGLHTPRRIDHIPTFASLNHDKNTRSTHYTPNAGIELSETTPPPLPVNPVQK